MDLTEQASDSAEFSPLGKLPDTMKEERDSSKESLRASLRGGRLDSNPDTSGALVSTL